MGSVLISVEDLEKASGVFVDDFSSGIMDDKIHRFPVVLQDVDKRYIVPMVVALGPYHRDSSVQLRNMEKVKRAAAFHFSEGWDWEGRPSLEKVQNAVKSVADDARKLYAADAVVGMEPNDFAEMMFLDACFLLQYMDAYPFFRSNQDSSVDEALRRFLFTNRACINNDIMLLENQLPWFVVETVINSVSSPQKNYMDVVQRFIQDMGNTFKIDADVKKDDASGSGDVSNNSNSPKPPHLLGLLRHHKTEPGTQVEWPHVGRISATSAIELAEIGINLKASKLALFTNMDVREWGPFCGELSLAPLSLNETRACWLVNMAAYEVSTASTFGDDHPNKTAVCSYLALFSMFMLREKDVHELRSKRILHSHQTNAELLTFFKTVIKLLPDTGCRFANVMVRIEDYKANRWIRTKVHQLVYRKFWTIVKVVTVGGSLVGIVQALLSLNKGHSL